MGARPGRNAHGPRERQGPEISKAGALPPATHDPPRTLTSKFPSTLIFYQRAVSITKLPWGDCRALGLPEHLAKLNIGHGCVRDGHGGRSVVSADKPMSTRSQQSFEDPCWLD